MQSSTDYLLRALRKKHYDADEISEKFRKIRGCINFGNCHNSYENRMNGCEGKFTEMERNGEVVYQSTAEPNDGDINQLRDYAYLMLTLLHCAERDVYWLENKPDCWEDLDFNLHVCINIPGYKSFGYLQLLDTINEYQSEFAEKSIQVLKKIQTAIQVSGSLCGISDDTERELVLCCCITGLELLAERYPQINSKDHVYYAPAIQFGLY